MDTSLILAIDQGGQSSRVALYTQHGEQLFCSSSSCATTHTRVDRTEHIEQNPDEILSGIKNSLEKIHAALGDETKNIVAAGFAGQGSSLLCWDNRTGKTLSPVLSWQDVRGAPFLKNISATHTQIAMLTGLRKSPHYGASKMRWCLENNQEVRHAQKNGSLSMGPIVSYIFWHLTGKNSVDPGHAQRTLLWNLETNDWDDSLLELFNIPRAVLPECKYHDSFFGSLQLNAHQINFTASARDQGASLFASGVPDKNTCYINIGTGAFIQRVIENLNAPEGLLISPLFLSQRNINIDVDASSPVCYSSQNADQVHLEQSQGPKKSLYALEATVNGAASAISFIQQQTGLQVTPEEIDSALLLDPDHDCYFLNAIGGLSAPYWRTDLLSRFSGEVSAHEKILAWVESIVFQIVVNVSLMNESRTLERISVSGGLSNANLICQKIADLTQIAVYRSENTDATLQGIAYMAGGMSNSWKKPNALHMFAPQQNSNLSKRFDIWQNAMKNWLAM